MKANNLIVFVEYFLISHNAFQSFLDVLLNFAPKKIGRIGPLHDPVTWNKITYTGEQIAQWDFQNNAPAFVLEVSLRNLLTSIYNFVPCDRVVQRAYWATTRALFGR